MNALRRKRFLSIAIGLALAASVAVAQDTPQQESATLESTEPGETIVQADREARLAKLLTGATLQGYFTLTGDQQAEGPPKLLGERYDLIEVRKLDEEGNWLFKARIRYGDHDVTLPMTLPVEWAGDTPVVVVDNVGFPGLGSYSARVLFHEHHYAGHWNSANHGGHLFGVIEKSRRQPPAPAPK